MYAFIIVMKLRRRQRIQRVNDFVAATRPIAQILVGGGGGKGKIEVL